MGNKTEQAPECICCSIEVQFAATEGITWLLLGSLAHCSLPATKPPNFQQSQAQHKLLPALPDSQQCSSDPQGSVLPWMTLTFRASLSPRHLQLLLPGRSYLQGAILMGKEKKKKKKKNCGRVKKKKRRPMRWSVWLEPPRAKKRQPSCPRCTPILPNPDIK